MSISVIGINQVDDAKYSTIIYEKYNHLVYSKLNLLSTEFRI